LGQGLEIWLWEICALCLLCGSVFSHACGAHMFIYKSYISKMVVPIFGNGSFKKYCLAPLFLHPSKAGDLRVVFCKAHDAAGHMSSILRLPFACWELRARSQSPAAPCCRQPSLARQLPLGNRGESQLLALSVRMMR